MRQHQVSTLAAICLLSLCAQAPAAPQPAAGFDPQRHMRVAEVRPGMKGYGLSVFSGTKIERFDVEVLSVLRNFSPRQDVVLIRVAGCNLEHTGAIAGMSGSPIYLRDDAGRDRLIGAFAYGWPLMKDPVAGVQPIEYMLSAPLDAPATAPSTQHAGASPGGPAAMPGVGSVGLDPRSNGITRWSVSDALAAARREFAEPPRTFSASPRTGVDAAAFPDPTQLRPLQTPLMVSGMPAALLRRLSAGFDDSGLVLLQAGGAPGGSAPAPSAAPAPAPGGAPAPATPPGPAFSPGSVLAVPLLTGDVEMTAVGTCTEVLGDRVYGFGHPFTSEGPVHLPMGNGSIQGVIANLMTSFKLGAINDVRGTLLSDRSTGVAGKTGEVPATAPITFHVRYADEAAERVYNYRAAIHPRFTPMLTAASLAGALSATRELPALNTIEYDLRVSFPGGRSMRMCDQVANAEPGQMVMEVSLPLLAAAVNPFQRMLPEKIEGTVVVSQGTKLAEIIRAQTGVRRYAPGEKAQISVTLRQFRGVEVVQPIEVEIPRDLPDGTYQLSLSGKDDYVGAAMALEPFRMTATNIDDVFAVLNELGQLRSNALYARLTLQPEGIALGRSALPRLPASARHVLSAAGRSDITAYTLTRSVILPVDYVVQGNADFQIQVDRRANLDTAPRRSQRPGTPPAAGPAGRTVPRGRGTVTPDMADGVELPAE